MSSVHPAAFFSKKISFVFFLIILISCESTNASEPYLKKPINEKVVLRTNSLVEAVDAKDPKEVLGHLKNGARTCGIDENEPIFLDIISKKNSVMVKVFLEFANGNNGIPEFINEAGFGNWSPLMVASLNGDHELVKELLRLGARAADINFGKMNAMSIAADLGHDECVKIIHSFIVDQTDREGETAFLKAAKKGHLETVKLLASIGAEIDAVNSSGENALILALKNGKEETADHLIDIGVPIKLERFSALIVATEKGYTNIVKKLLDKKIDVDLVKGGFNHTALMKAVIHDRLEIFKLILSKNPDLELKSKAVKGKDTDVAEKDVAALIKEHNRSSFQKILDQHTRKPWYRRILDKFFKLF